jgi:uncharacterized protein with NRDE domain
MCLILFSFQETERYPLVLAANRDEFYKRPTAPAQFWPDAPDIFAGRDLLQGGTWLGVSRTGRIAAVTNFRGPDNSPERTASRGLLVSNFLRGVQGPEEYLNEVNVRADSYNGFNLILGTVDELFYYSNQERIARKLSRGVFGLSNHLLDSPWPKVVRGREALSQLVRDSEAEMSEKAFQLLNDQSAAPDTLLPDTGISRELERALSATFISTPEYGTRASTVITIDANREVTFVEKSFGEGGIFQNEARAKFASVYSRN